MKTPNHRDYDSPPVPCSEGGNPLTKFVNLYQTPQERRDKYAFCRFFGLKYSLCYTMRDWHWPKINGFIEALNKTIALPLPGGEPTTTD